MKRRQFVTGAAALAGAAAFTSAAAAPAWAGKPVNSPTVTDLGPASSVTATGAAEKIGSLIWTATSGVSPVQVGGVNITTGLVEKKVSLPTGAGVWGMTSIGTDLYVATYTPGHLYRLDTNTMALTMVANLGTFVWSLAATPDGHVVAGTFPDGAVWEYDPATGQTRNFGRAFGSEQYVRSIAADEKYIYAGVGTKAHLMVIDRVTGERRDVLPTAYANRTFVATLARRGTTLAAGLSPTGTMLVYDTTQLSEPVPVQLGADSFVVAIEISRDGRTVWAASRPSGTLWSYDTITKKLTSHGQPYDGATFNRIFDTAEWGLVGSLTSQMVKINPGPPATFTGIDLAQSGLPPAPELTMWLGVAKGHGSEDIVYATGKAGIQIHHVAKDGTSTNNRIFLPGEAKTVTVDGDTVNLGVYTLAKIWQMDLDGTNLREVAAVGNQQTRPTDAELQGKTFWMTTEPDYGQYGGALVRYEGGELTVWRNLVPQQSIQSLAVDGNTVYLGSNIRNSLGTTPVATAATISAVDGRTGKVLWQVTPLADASLYRDLALMQGRLVAADNTGRVVRLDKKGAVEEVATVGTTAMSFATARGDLFATDGKSVFAFRQVHKSLAGQAIVTDLASQTYSGAMIAASPNGSTLYTLKGRNLVRIAI